MNTLEQFATRNPLVLEEARQLSYKPLGEMVGRSDSEDTKFYSLGSFESLVLGNEVYGGLKIRPKDERAKFSERLNHYFIASLSNLIILDEICPELRHMIPRFFGAVVKDDKFNGILMEDYTRNRQLVVRDFRWPKSDEFPEGFLDKLKIDPADQCDLDDLAHVFGLTKEGLKIMDINRIPWLPQYDQMRMELFFELSERRGGLDSYLIK